MLRAMARGIRTITRVPNRRCTCTIGEEIKAEVFLEASGNPT